MAGKGRKKATKKKSSVAGTSSATATPTQEDGAAPSATATPSAAATATSSATGTPTQEDGATPSATATSSVARDCVSGPLNVHVQYVDSPLSIWAEFQPLTPAETALQAAGRLGVETFAQMLGTDSSNLHAEPTYPAVLGGRKLTVSQWSQIGLKPFVAVSPTETSGFGLHDQKLAALDELQKCREENISLLDSELAWQAHEKLRLEEAPGCEKCPLLVGMVRRLEEKMERMEKKWQDKEKKWEDKEKKWEDKEKKWQDKEKKWQDKEKKWEDKEKKWEEKESTWEAKETKYASQIDQISTLLHMVEDLRMVRRRNIIEKARAKVVHEFGMRVEDVESWLQFFTENEHAILQLGVSERLFSLLKTGKRRLHKVVHEASLRKMADSVLSLDAASNERGQYEDAFRFAFDRDATGFFAGTEMDESDCDL